MFLQKIYCKTTGVEYMHLNNLEQQDWIRQRFEAPRVTELSHDQKKVRLEPSSYNLICRYYLNDSFVLPNLKNSSQRSGLVKNVLVLKVVKS